MDAIDLQLEKQPKSASFDFWSYLSSTFFSFCFTFIDSLSTESWLNSDFQTVVLLLLRVNGSILVNGSELGESYCCLQLVTFTLGHELQGISLCWSQYCG